MIVTSAQTHTNVPEQTRFLSRWWAEEVDHDMSDFDEIIDEEQDWSDFHDTAEHDDFHVSQRSDGPD